MKFETVKFKQQKLSLKEISKRSKNFYNLIKKRRSIRNFDKIKINDEIIKNAILSAGSAPSGANLQPWHFVIVKNQNLKRKIRIAAEKEEIDFYNNKAPKQWLNALKSLGTNSKKKFLEDAPILIGIFEQKYKIINKNIKLKNYYVKESVGIATGILISSLHYSGLSMLTHTPSPMTFLNKILKRPINERPYLILVVGQANKNCFVPKFATKKKSIKNISTWI